MDDHFNDPRPDYLDQLLLQHLRALLPQIDDTALRQLRAQMRWVELAGGATLMSQGEAGDAMYLLVSGRLRAYIAHEPDEAPRAVRDISRGQVVGEMSLYTDEPRSATLVAVRDSVLARLGKAEFLQLLQASAQASVALTRQVIHRLQTEGALTVSDRPVAIGLLPISAGVDVRDVAQRLAVPLRTHGRVAVIDAPAIDAALGVAGISQSAADDAQANRRIAVHLDEVEAQHDFVLLLADDGPTAWTHRCSRHCDELLLLADANQPPAIHPTETQCLIERPPRTEAAEVLVLLHPADRRAPTGTRGWLARRPLADHVHVRPAREADMARLARLQARAATGLVFAGGGARGLAHLGVLRALAERGIEVDVVGGTSIGAVMAAYAAADRPLEQVMANARRAFASNPTGDFNWLPMISLIKGRRLRRIIDQGLRELIGDTPDAEDLWKGWFCVATNYSQAREQVLRHGPLHKLLLASIAIPGALPPVILDGDLLCDGGTFNNFPVDVMRARRGVGRVIGVDLNARRLRRLDNDEVPGTWALLLDRLRPRSRRRYRLPTLANYLINVTILYSMSRQRAARELAHLYLNPPLERVGMLQWGRFDDIVRQGYEHACEVMGPPAAAPASG